MVRRTKDEAERTRGAILDAAEKVFFARGVSRTSLEEIAAAAKVTRGAVYWHFKDKIELCHAMTERVFLPHEDMLEELANNPSDNPLDDLKKSTLHALKLLARDKRRRDVVTILFMRCEYVDEMQQIAERSHACKHRMLASSEKLLKLAHQRKLLAAGWPPRLAAMALQSLVSGIILGALEGRKGYTLSASGIRCVEAFFSSLKAR